MMRTRGRPLGALVIAFAICLVVAACDGTGDPGTAPANPTTTTATTTTVAPTTTTAAPTTTTAAPTTTTTTTTTVPSGGGGSTGFTKTDTGYSHLRVSIQTNAAWVTTYLNGISILASKTTSTSGNSRVTGLGGNMISVSGDGTAVVELVVLIPTGTSPSMSMCKNYLGPATVSITRLTDGATPVFSFTNYGANPVVPSGSCENYAQAALDRSALIGPTRWPARHDSRALVLANYYPWYDSTTLQTNFGDNPIGPANTSDPAVVAQAIALARSSGIDAFVTEYDSLATTTARLDLVYAAADQRTDFNVAMLVDFDGLAGHNGGTITDQTLDAALNAVAARASHPSQLRMGANPVIFLFDAAKVSSAQWSAALDRLAARTNVRPYVVADGAGLGSPAQYCYGTQSLSTADQLNKYATDTLYNMQLLPGLDGRSGPLWVAPVSPGYDDSRLGRPSSTVIPRAGGARYDQNWSAMLQSLPDWIMITSWNEYYEQTHVAPGTTTGYQALQQTTSWAASFHQTG